MSSSNPKLLLLGTAPGLLGDTSATASLANRPVTNIGRYSEQAPLQACALSHPWLYRSADSPVLTSHNTMLKIQQHHQA